MKKTLLLLFVTLLSCMVFISCGPSSEDILKLYEGYALVDDDSNKSGITLEVEKFLDDYLIKVIPTNTLLTETDKFTDDIAGRLVVADAQDTSKTVPCKYMLIDTTTNSADGSVTQEHYPGIQISKSDMKKYILVYFSGIDASEAEEIVTLPLFFIVKHDGKELKVITPQPLLADDALIQMLG